MTVNHKKKKKIIIKRKMGMLIWFTLRIDRLTFSYVESECLKNEISIWINAIKLSEGQINSGWYFLFNNINSIGLQNSWISLKKKKK